MALIIKGMPMPTQRSIFIEITPVGGVNEIINPFLSVSIGLATELPPHGRLIDADALVEAIKTTQPYYPLILFGTSEEQKAIYIQKIVETINAQPTIIEAEGKETLKDRLAECDAGDLFTELAEEEKEENKRLAKDFKEAEGSRT